MKRYEMIREIFNGCSRNRMRDVFISELETDDPEKIVDEYKVGNDILCEKIQVNEHTVKYDLVIDGLEQRLTFTEI